MPIGKTHLVGKLLSAEGRPQNVELIADNRPNITESEAAAGIVTVDSDYLHADINRYFADPSATAAQNTTAIQAAIDSANGKTITASLPGTYLVESNQDITLESGLNTTCFIMTSNMHFDMPGVILKQADDQSTDGTPKRINMFATNGVLENVSFRNIVMDGNGANNPTSPSRPTVYDLSLNMAFINVSGTPSSIAAKITHCVVEGCTFKNCSGVSCILMGQDNTGFAMGKDWLIKNNKFLNNGTDTSDHTCIYAWADDVICDGNVFENDDPYATTGNTGLAASYETHGSNHVFTNNRIINAERGIWVSANYFSKSLHVIVANNTFDVAFFGISFSSFGEKMDDILIEGNSFFIDNICRSTRT